jgi:5-methylcytosine-specific restriction enzyme A
MSIKDDLKPTNKNKVIDLVAAAGVDVSDWENFARGVRWAAANPKYCYEWSFIQPGKVVVLNLWHASLQEHDNIVYVTMNMRKEAQRLHHIKAKSLWIKRASKMDDAFMTAFKDHLTIRVIINEGEMRDTANPKAKASVVNRQFLDPMPWYISAYDLSSGNAVLFRGKAVLAGIDQFNLDSAETPAPQQVIVAGKVFVRDSSVRAAALARAKGHCEFCGQPGFVTSNGQPFLETHHIIPLSEGGGDVITNVAALCANHHREAHHGVRAKLIRDNLLALTASYKKAA